MQKLKFTGVILKVESLAPGGFNPAPSININSNSNRNSNNNSNNQNNNTSDSGSTYDKPKKENWCSVGVQIFIPFMIAGMGTIGAGLVLGSVESLTVFKQVSALYILVPSILGLKGNLDMCLASRMSTQANLGNMSSNKEVLIMIIGNVGLVQVPVTHLLKKCLFEGTFAFRFKPSLHRV